MRSSRLLRSSIALLAVAIFAMPASGAHLYRCLDDRQPAAILHVGDDGNHHDTADERSHSDVEVSLENRVLVTKMGSAPNVPAPFAGIPAMLVLPAAESDALPDDGALATLPFRVFRFQPPLRAPPA